MKTKTQKHRLPNESETSWKHTPNAKTAKKNDVCTVTTKGQIFDSLTDGVSDILDDKFGDSMSFYKVDGKL